MAAHAKRVEIASGDRAELERLARCRSTTVRCPG